MNACALTRNLSRWLFVMALLLSGCQCTMAQAEEWTASQTEPLLTTPILDVNQTLADVQQFARARVARLPELTTAEAWEDYAAKLRQQVLDEVVFRGEAIQWRQRPLRVEYLSEIPADGYRIRKLRYEALPGVWIPALLYEPTELTAKTVAVLNVNGHDSQGKAADYKQLRCINMARRGMLALNVEWLGMGQLQADGFNHYRAVQVELAGTSAVSIFFLAMQRGLDVLLEHPYTDPQRVAVTGLSGGGWQTIFLSSLDTRVKLANPVAGYSSFLTRIDYLSDLGDTEQTPTDLAALADYAHLTAMLAPRPALLTFNDKDQCCFRADHALEPLVRGAAPVFALLGVANALGTHVNSDPGTHNFELDNRQALYRFLGEHFLPQADVDWNEELATADDELTAEQLHVPLPGGGRDFQRIALDLTQDLPPARPWPADPNEVRARQADLRAQLGELVRWQDYNLPEVETIGTDTFSGGQIERLKLRVGGEWTIPVVVIIPDKAAGTAILIADHGRGALAVEAAERLNRGERVVAVDPFYFGEAAVAERDYLFALLISSVQERPLGIQAGQLAAVARWCHEREWGPVTLASRGPRTGTIALLAAAMETQRINKVVLQEAFASLRDPISANESAMTMPEQFCFGLLTQFDLPQIACLVAPRPLAWQSQGQRPRSAEINTVYEVLGASPPTLTDAQERAPD